ncbi:hypothetical protein K503DRAFT_806602 [Rhizopogon vinicolor AM-OR11-026]|uniref:Uncharacterized protein n=1 Tax=Rhizopogon vinicolor AM-OR11-026 TaxID=1314800 RepID=A0A1B7ME58_9AGAM|nr:hypothetical protein K503DRAFT_806602 [Rhizopogon vinicolor AM-OR11-026]
MAPLRCSTLPRGSKLPFWRIGVYALCLFQNDRLLASTSRDDTARLWNLDTNIQVGQPLQHKHTVTGAAFSPDGKLLATGCEDKNAYVWDICTILKDAGLEDLLSLPNVPRNVLEQQVRITEQITLISHMQSSLERRLWNTSPKPTERTPEGNVGRGNGDAEYDKNVDRLRYNDKGQDQQVLPAGAETPSSDDPPAAHDSNVNRMLWKSLMHARGKNISSNYHKEENGGCEDKLRQKEDDGQRKASTLPYSESTATGAQTRQESMDVSDSLPDLTNHLQGRSDYPIASGGFGDIWKCELVKLNETVEVAVKTIRAFDAGNDISVRKNSKVYLLS